MKRKYAAMILGLTMALTSVNMAYAATDTTTEAAADETADSEDASATTDNSVESIEVYGEVTAVGEDSITINVGTLKEGQQPGDGEAPKDGEKPEDAKDAKDDSTDNAEDSKEDVDSTDESEDAAAEDTADTSDADNKDAQPDDSMGAPDGEAPSMLDLTGASQEIKVTDTTTYEKQAAPEKPEDGQAPQDGEKAEDGQAPEMKTEAIALTDIQVGDTIKVTLDADGNATAVVVMNAGVPEAKDGDAKGSDKKTADSKSDASETVSSDSTDSTTDTK